MDTATWRGLHCPQKACFNQKHPSQGTENHSNGEKNNSCATLKWMETHSSPANRQMTHGRSVQCEPHPHPRPRCSASAPQRPFQEQSNYAWPSLHWTSLVLSCHEAEKIQDMKRKQPAQPALRWSPKRCPAKGPNTGAPFWIRRWTRKREGRIYIAALKNPAMMVWHGVVFRDWKDILHVKWKKLVDQSLSSSVDCRWMRLCLLLSSSLVDKVHEIFLWACCNITTCQNKTMILECHS